MAHRIGSQMPGAGSDRERMSSGEVWLRALDALEAAAAHSTTDARGSAIGEALDGLPADELTRVCAVLAELAADRVPRAMLGRRFHGDRSERLAALIEATRLEAVWHDS